MAETKIKSEEIEILRQTGDNLFDTKKDVTTNIPDDKEIESEVEETEKGKPLTPLEISRTKYYDSEKDKNEAKAKLFDAFRYAIYIVLGLGAIYGIFWAYKVNNIAEPIGGMKVEIRYIKESISDIKNKVQKLQDKVDKVEQNQNKVK
jgi:cell division protein FtsB